MAVGKPLFAPNSGWSFSEADGTVYFDEPTADGNLAFVGIKSPTTKYPLVIENERTEANGPVFVRLRSADGLLAQLMGGTNQFFFVTNSGKALSFAVGDLGGVNSDLLMDATNKYLAIKAIAGTPAARVGGVIETLTTDTGNVGAGEDDLHSHTVAAAMLAVNGECLEFEMWFSFAANANSKRVRVKYGATTLYDSGAQNQNGGVMKVAGRIIRTGAATQKALVHITMDAATDLFDPVDLAITTPAETLSGTVVLKATGEAVADNDVLQRYTEVRWVPQT